MYKVSKIETIQGTYWLVYDIENNLYGISKTEVKSMHCGYASLTALFKTKGM